MENPEQVIRSFALQSAFAGGPVTEDKLVPKEFGRIKSPFICTWREEQLSTVLDWESRGFSFYLPESLRVVASFYLKVTLPALSGGANYKRAPGLYVIENLRFLSAGTEAYSVDPSLYLRDYIESLDDNHAAAFMSTYLGGMATTGDARECLIPILLPNSAYGGRVGHDYHYGKGVWPCFTGQNRLEVQFTLNSANMLTNDPQHVPASISGACSIMIHQVNMKKENIPRYSDARGTYSIINRRFTEITSGWTDAAAGTMKHVTQNQPIGTVTEIFCLAVPHKSTAMASTRDILATVDPEHFEIVSDTVVQKRLDSLQKVQIEKWTNGFCENTWSTVPARLCFAAHASESESVYSGGFNMAQSGQIQINIKFPTHTDFRLFAVQLQRVELSELGHLTASLQG